MLWSLRDLSVRGTLSGSLAAAGSGQCFSSLPQSNKDCCHQLQFKKVELAVFGHRTRASLGWPEKDIEDHYNNNPATQQGVQDKKGSWVALAELSK